MKNKVKQISQNTEKKDKRKYKGNGKKLEDQIRRMGTRRVCVCVCEKWEG